MRVGPPVPPPLPPDQSESSAAQQAKGEHHSHGVHAKSHHHVGEHEHHPATRRAGKPPGAAKNSPLKPRRPPTKSGAGAASGASGDEGDDDTGPDLGSASETHATVASSAEASDKRDDSGGGHGQSEDQSRGSGSRAGLRDAQDLRDLSDGSNVATRRAAENAVRLANLQNLNSPSRGNVVKSMREAAERGDWPQLVESFAAGLLQSANQTQGQELFGKQASHLRMDLMVFMLQLIDAQQEAGKVYQQPFTMAGIRDMLIRLQEDAGRPSKGDLTNAAQNVNALIPLMVSQIGIRRNRTQSRQAAARTEMGQAMMAHALRGGIKA